MAVALEAVVKQLTDSGIIAPGKLENFVPPKAHPKNTEDLVAELVKQNQLTKFQAQQVAAGKVKSLILGNYTILDRIGAGGMGQVFKAEHRRMERTVAIKMLPPTMTKDAAAVARFQREVKAAAKLRHPNIVAADDADEANGAHFLVMEYVEGSDLSALVKKNGPFPFAKAVNYILQAARGLEFAHSEGVVHRDIKPANLLLDKKGVVKILDMGLARIETDGDAAKQAELTGTGAVMGTVDYMAPEQAMSTKTADARADIYSLGCSLFYLLVGKPTFDGETVTAKLIAHQAHPIPELRAACPEAPEELETVFNKMLAKKVVDRYQAMTEVIADLERLSSGQATSANIQPSGVTQLAPEAMTFLKSIEATPTIQKTKATTKAAVASPAAPPTVGKGYNKSLVYGGAAIVGVALLAGVIISLRSGDHNLVVEVNEPDAVVTISNTQGKVEITRKSDKTPLTISVDPGQHRLRVEKDGFQFLTQDFTVEAEGKTTLKARLVPVKVATGQSNKSWNTPAFQQWMKTVAALPADRQVEAVTKKLQELNPGFDGKVRGWDGRATPKIENGVVMELMFSTDNVTDISPVRALTGLKSLSCSGVDAEKRKLSDLSPLQGLLLTRLGCSYSQVSDLSPLQGMPLTSLSCSGSQVSNLSPLQGMPLTALHCLNTQVSDLSPLRGMPLTTLGCKGTKVSDLSPLKGMKLTILDCSHTPVSDLSLLTSVSTLDSLNVKITKVTAAGVAALQKALPNCKIEWDDPAKTTKTWETPAFQQWMKAVAALSADKQVEAVSKKLMELNPGFNGKLTGAAYKDTGPPKIEKGIVTELGLVTDYITDISPVRALVGLKWLNCGGAGKGQFSDLSPLKEMPLTYLGCYNTQVSDLSPLQGMPLATLNCYGAPVSDLSPLKDCKSLTSLAIVNTKATAPGVADLHTALPNCKIEWPTDNQFYAQPTVTAKPISTFNDPAFQQWMKDVAAMPADKQIESVSKKLQELNPGFDGKLTDADRKTSPLIENGLVTTIGFITDDVSDISPVRVLAGLRYLSCAGSGAGKGKLTDLSPVRGMQLRGLSCFYNPIVDLSPVEGMPLSYLNCFNSQVSSLGPLQGMQLKKLYFNRTQVLDLSPLRGMNLELLACFDTKVSDLTPLVGMELTAIEVTPQTVVTGLDVIRQMKSLKTIGVGSADKEKFSPAEFWTKYDAGDFGRPATPGKLFMHAPAFQQWTKDVAAMPADKQLEAVVKKLQELNPGFDGKVTSATGKGDPAISNGVVSSLGFRANEVSDLSPVRALAGLQYFSCGGNNPGKGKLADLSPLKGLPLIGLTVFHALVTDASPLEDCQSLKSVTFSDTWMTAASVARLQASLPSCKINWDQLTDASGRNRRLAEWIVSDKKKGWTLQILADSGPISIVDVQKLPTEPFVVNGVGMSKTATDADLVQFDGPWGVTSLNLNDTPITDEGVAHLKGATSLMILGLSGTRISDSGIAHLSGLTKLKTLGLQRTRVGDPGLLHLRQLAALESLDLRKTQITAAGVAALQNALPNCKIDWDDPTKATPTQPATPGTK